MSVRVQEILSCLRCESGGLTGVGAGDDDGLAVHLDAAVADAEGYVAVEPGEQDDEGGHQERCEQHGHRDVSVLCVQLLDDLPQGHGCCTRTRPSESSGRCWRRRIRLLWCVVQTIGLSEVQTMHTLFKLNIYSTTGVTTIG